MSRVWVLCLLLLLVAWLHVQSARTGALAINGLACPGTVVDLNATVDLHTTVQPGTTYSLAPGVYTVSGTVRASFCCFIGNGTSRSDVVIRPPNGAAFVALFVADASANPSSLALGVQHLTIDGLGIMGAMALYNPDGPALSAEDTTIQNCATGPAVVVERGDVQIAHSSFLSNSNDGSSGVSPQGGALLLSGAGGGRTFDTFLDQVEFIGNTAGGQGGAGQGGAVFMESQVSCQMTEMTFRNNFATDRGGAIYMAGQLTPQPVATLAAMCASNNSATFGGGFAYLESGTAVTFTDATNSHVGDSRPNTIEISGSATVTSTGTPGGWATGSYTLIGPVGPACAAQFANNTANDNSCNSCSGGTSWFAVLCSCQGPLNVTTVNATQSAVLPGSTFTVQVTLQFALTSDGNVTVVASPSPGITCQPAFIEQGATNATVTCTVGMTAVPGQYTLTADVTTATQETASGAGTIQVLKSPCPVSCSNKGSECCDAQGCVKPANTLCRSAAGQSCAQDLYCDGTSPYCQGQAFRPDGTTCSLSSSVMQTLQARTESGEPVPSASLQWADEATATKLLETTTSARPSYARQDDWRPCVGACWGGQCNLQLFNALYHPNSISGCCRVGPSEAEAVSDQAAAAAPISLRYEARRGFVCWELSRDRYEEYEGRDGRQGYYRQG